MAKTTLGRARGEEEDEEAEVKSRERFPPGKLVKVEESITNVEMPNRD